MPDRKMLKAAKKEAPEDGKSLVVRGKGKSSVSSGRSTAKVKPSRVRSLAIRKALARENRFDSPRDLAAQARRIARKRPANQTSPGNDVETE